MALSGDGFLAMWMDIDPDYEDAFLTWNTFEHMPERLGVTGFLSGRRYLRLDGESHRYFTLYEATSFSVFTSDAYLERLNNPTMLSKRISPFVRNFRRAICRTVYSDGMAKGGHIATVRFTPNTRYPASSAASTGDRLLGLDGVVAVHIGVADVEATDVETIERNFRPRTDNDSFDAIAVVEALGAESLEAQLSKIVEVIGKQCVTGDVPDVARYGLSVEVTAASPKPKSDSGGLTRLRNAAET